MSATAQIYLELQFCVGPIELHVKNPGVSIILYLPHIRIRRLKENKTFRHNIAWCKVVQLAVSTSWGTAF